jgi:cytochrome P450 family 110
VTALPPGPSGPLSQGFSYSSDPYGYSARLYARYGDPFTLPMPTGPVVVCGHPDAARAVFTAPPDHFDVWAKDQLVPVFGEDSIFTVTGEAHRRHRRAVVQASKCRGAMPDICRERVEALRPGQTLDVAPFLLDLSLAVILDVVFGARGDEELGALLHDYVDVSGATSLVLPLCYPSLRRRLYPPWASFLRLRSRLRARLGALAAHRRAAPMLREDALGALIEHQSDEAAVDDLVTLLVAGHETTARALSFALDGLQHAPEALGKLQSEIDSFTGDPSLAELAELTYLDAVCEETLRLHPVVVQVTRTLREPLDVLGHRLPSGVSVALSAYLVHRRPDLYPDPEAFRPDRFLERHYGPFENFPFGGGATRCPGAAFAKDEMKLVLFHLLRRFSLSSTRKRPARAVVRGLVMAPEGKLPMTLAPR